MVRVIGYRVLCVFLGLCWLAVGANLFAMFLGYHSPGGRSEGLFSTMGPYGHYMAAFAGCALLVWALLLLAAAWRPFEGQSVAAATVFGLVLCAVYRMIAWTVGDYADVRDLLQLESAVFLVLALAFVWLCPPARTGSVAS